MRMPRPGGAVDDRRSRARRRAAPGSLPAVSGEVERSWLAARRVPASPQWTSRPTTTITAAGRAGPCGLGDGPCRRSSQSVAQRTGSIRSRSKAETWPRYSSHSGALVAQEEVEDVLAQRLGQQLGVLGDRDRVVQAARQRLDAEALALALGERPDVVLGLARQLVVLLDALHAGGEHDGVREVGVAGGVDGAQLDAGRDWPLLRLVHRHPDHRRAVVVAPADVRRGLAAADQPLVAVDPLVGDRR